jgi:hypothetical protein
LFCHFQVPPAEACDEEGKENSGDDGGAAAPIPASVKKSEHRSGKNILSEDECRSQALNFMKMVPDEYDTFGEYVAMELISLSSDTCRRMLKREIHQSVAHMAETDE